MPSVIPAAGMAMRGRRAARASRLMGKVRFPPDPHRMPTGAPPNFLLWPWLAARSLQASLFGSPPKCQTFGYPCPGLPDAQK